MKNTEISEKVNVLHDIAAASNAIRRKYKLIKSQRYMDDERINEVLKPVVTPLKKMVDSSLSASALHSSASPSPLSASSKRVKKRRSMDVQERASSSSLPPPSSSSSTDTDTLYDDVINIPDASDDSQDETYRPSRLSLSSQSSLLSTSGNPLVDEYLAKFKNASSFAKLDTIYGVRDDSIEDRLMVGAKPIKFGKSTINIGSIPFSPTRGLLELLFMKQPDEATITKEDLANYARIVKIANLHLTGYASDGALRKGRSKKFLNIIKKIVEQSEKLGRGLPHHMIVTPETKIDYVYWDDENELVDRLRLLLASQQAGNSNHNNEIISIIEELREAGIVY